MWGFCPSIEAAYLFTVLFGLTSLAHVAQAIIYRKFYCWVIAIAATIQTVTYIFRVLSILNPASYNNYAAWFVLILVAPIWTNAFVYMVMGRMVWNFIDDAQVLRVRPWQFGLLFVILDIMYVVCLCLILNTYQQRSSAFVIQVYGAAQAAGNNVSHSAEMTGLHIYMGGVGVQQLFIVIFTVCAIEFHRKVLSQRRSDAGRALILLYILYACLALITVSRYSQSYETQANKPRHASYSVFVNMHKALIARFHFTRLTSTASTPCLCYWRWWRSMLYIQAVSCQVKTRTYLTASSERKET
ncbi:hypothetical protein N7462_001182 [Penicillium macrosclerotiorum]|uniref:uncharacterized protein n=1 Tax=Penicillium macrosclerotiorum TaxID=303699 RepID=UPI0025485433|nr:uncharacterized protein N7462_001182 [Penicillium macrosclerotiorum]KAJ5691759.1 hypothetical protein N7462_001182 [Penicillium macrosclerotiorum]